MNLILGFRGKDTFQQCKRIAAARAYFKRGVQPKCVVQMGKRGVQNLEMWSPNSQCFCFWTAIQASVLCWLPCYGCRLRRLVCYMQTTSKKCFENTKQSNANKVLYLHILTLNLKEFLNLTNNKVMLVLVRTVLIKCGLILHHCVKYFQKVISKIFCK